MKPKHSKALLVSAIIGTLYMIFLIANFGGAIANSTDAREQAGAKNRNSISNTTYDISCNSINI